MFDSSSETGKTIVLLLVDPHCSYSMGLSVSLASAASRFCLSYFSQITGFMIAAVFFALNRQARAWELDTSVPSILSAIESNLRMPLPFLFCAILPVFISLPVILLTRSQLPPIANYISISILCYLVANGAIMILIFSSLLVLHTVAAVHVYIRKSWMAWEDIILFHQILRFTSFFCSMKVLKNNATFVVAFVAIPLIYFIHPALGLLVLLFSHAFNCHAALCSHAQRKEHSDSRTYHEPSIQSPDRANDGLDPLLPLDESYSPTTSKSFSDSQLEYFNYQLSILILHLLALLMFLPSLVAWFQRIRLGQSFPWFIDSLLCTGVILHGLCGSRPDMNSISLPLQWTRRSEAGLSLAYLLAGYFTFINALFSAPYKAFYPMAAIGAFCCIVKIIDRRNRERGDARSRNKRRHSHKH